MKKTLLLLAMLCVAFSFAFTQTPVLSNYPATAVVTGGNTMVNPASVPANAMGITAFTSPGFKGQLLVNRLTGVVSIINAYPAGAYNITIKAFNGTLTASSGFTLTVANAVCSPGLFTTMPDVLTGGMEVRNLVIGDFNNDGKQDFAATNALSGTVSVRLGDGMGNFTTASSFTVGEFPQAIAAGDFNADGNQDLITANYTSTAVSVSLGYGTGSFAPATSVSVAGNPISVVVNDFNGDGKQDFATTSNTNSNISVRLGNGNGNFTATTDVLVGATPYYLVVGDFNGDGKSDLATANYNGASVSVRLGDGTGNFSGTTTIAVGTGPFYIATGDFNGDSKADIVTANNTARTVSVRYGDGTGNFTGTTTLTADIGLTSIAIGDFNGDGKADIAGTNYTSAYISMWLGNGVGAFIATTSIPISNGPYTAVPGDFNGDGRQDLAIACGSSNTVTIRLNNTNSIEIKGNNTTIAAGDTTPSLSNYTEFGSVSNSLIRTYTIANTGNVNLIVNSINTDGSDSAMFIRGGIILPATITPGSSIPFTISFNPAGTGLKTATVKVNNTDCKKALYNFAVQGTAVTVVPTIGTYPTAMVISGGNLTLIPSAVPINPIGIYAYTSVRFKGLLQVDTATGKLIITDAHPAGTYTITVKAIHGSSSATTSFTLTVTNPLCGQGAFSSTTNWSTGIGPRGIAIADFNNDGNQDIAVANTNSGTVTIRLGDGSGGLGLLSTQLMEANPYAIAAGDLNGDGRADFVTCNTDANTVSVRLGNGAGSFATMPAVSTGNGPYAVAIGDFNGDRKPDFATANTNTNTISIRLGNGAGGFSSSAEVTIGTVGANPFAIAIGDFNNDGYADFAAAINGSSISNVAIGLGDGTGNFIVAAPVTVGNNPVSVAIGEFNGDGNLDLAVANQSSNSVSIRLGNGTGGFSGTTNIPAASLPLALATGDFNSDGKTDFVLTINGTSLVSVYLGNGSGGFSIAGNVTTASNSRSIAVGDFNGDGRQDFVTANAGANTASIRFGSAGDISLRGNNLPISNSDTLPDVNDYTDFEAVNPGAVRTFTVLNKGLLGLTVNSITLSGGDSSLFRVSGINLPATIAPGATTSFNVLFAPVAAGLKTTTVKIISNDCDEPIYRFAIQGSLIGAALAFDGVDDQIAINDTTGNIGAADITLSAWIKTTATTASSIISKRNCVQGNYFDFGITTAGKLSLAFANGGITIQLLIGNTPVNDGIWHQVTAVRSGTVLTTYVDGVLDTTITNTDTAIISNNATLTIGAIGCSNTPAFFEGAMDEVRLYTRGLNSCEIQSNRRCELDNQPTGLLAYYRFNQGSALGNNTGKDTLYDNSGKRNNGVLRNFTLTDSVSNWIQQGGVATGIVCTGNNVWLGITSDWNVPANWSTGFVPTACTRVVVRSDVPFMPEVTSPNSACFSLTLNNGATITIKTGGYLTITANN